MALHRREGGGDGQGAAANPMRHPVIAYVLEKPPIVTVRSAMSGPSEATLVKDAPAWTRSPYISSVTMISPCSTAIWASARSSERS